MQLVMLEGINKEELLANLDAMEREREQQEESTIELYDPRAGIGEVVDKAVLEKIKECREAKTKKAETEEVEIKKFRNAVTFTDIPETIKKADFHPDGSPRLAIAGLLHSDVRFDISSSQKAKYCSRSKISFSDDFNIVLADVKTDWRNQICFFVGLAGCLASMLIAILPTHSIGMNYYNGTIPIIGFAIPFVTLIMVSLFSVIRYDNPFACLELPDIGKVRTRSNFSTEVPPVSERVLSKISGPGPFAILFEVTQGWKKVETDPVIFRVINIGDQQFFEPLVGYDMTPLEKRSLVPA